MGKKSSEAIREIKAKEKAIRDIRVKKEAKARADAKIKAKANRASKPMDKANQTIHLQMFLRRWGGGDGGKAIPRTQSTYHLRGVDDPYTVSPRTQRHIKYICSNPTSLRVNPSLRPYERILAAITKLVTLCSQPDPHLPDIEAFCTANQSLIFPGNGQAAIRALEIAVEPEDPDDPSSYKFSRGITQTRTKRCPLVHDYLTRELDIDLDTQLKRLVIMNYSDITGIIMQHCSHSGALVAIKTMSEKEFMKLVVCAGTVGDTKLMIRLLEERKGTKALSIGSIVVGLLTVGYRRNIELFAIFLYLFVGKVRLEPELQHYSRYVLMHTARIGNRGIFALTLRSIDFAWLNDTNTKTHIELDECTIVPKRILPYIIEVLAQNPSSTMIDAFVSYLRPRVSKFGLEYRFAITEACRNRHMAASRILLLAYTMTAAEASTLLRITDDIDDCDSLVEAIMMSYMTYRDSPSSDNEDMLVIDDEVIDEGCVGSSPSEWYTASSPDVASPNRAPYLLDDYGSDLAVEPLGLMV